MDIQPHVPQRYPDHGAWAEMLAEIHDKNTKLGELVSKRWPRRSGTAILTELERERSRIARELHAGAGQPLAGIKLHLEILGECASAPNPCRTGIKPGTRSIPSPSSTRMAGNDDGSGDGIPD